MMPEPIARFVDAAALPGRPRALPTKGPTALLDEQLAHEVADGTSRSALLKRLLAASDVLASLLAGGVAAVVTGLDGGTAALYVLVTVVLWLAVDFAVGLYAVETLGGWASGIPQLGRLAGTALLMSWPLVGVGHLTDGANPVTGALVGSLVILGLAATGRTASRSVLQRVEPLRQRTVVLGSGMVAGSIVDRLRRHDELGLDPIGLIDDDVHELADTGLPLLGPIDELPAILRRHDVDRVIIAFSRASHEQLLASMRACREEKVAVDVVPRLFEFLEGGSIEQIGGMPVLSIGVPRLPRTSALAKRGLDVLLSGLGLTVLALPMALIALAIRLDSRGPVFFRQPRAGRKGEIFQLIKFRSMCDGADAQKDGLAEQNEKDDGVMFKMRRDPRITRVGGVLRRLSLDELPQLINVLRGQMSLVGPRPLVLAESDALGTSWHARRLDLRPGITGPWQVSGRADLSVHDMVRLDFQYVTGWSLARDVEILLTTIPAVVRGHGAY